MISRPAENSFQKGLATLRSGEVRPALAFFEAAMRQDRLVNPQDPTMKYLSYYGLALALSTDQLRHAHDLCVRASEREFYNPDIFWNLGRVSLLRGDRRRAVKAFDRGLRLDSRHPGLRFEMRQLGVRKRPFFGFLDRGHPLNRLVGRIRTVEARA